MKYPKGTFDDTASDAYIEEELRKFLSENTDPVVYVNESNGLQALPILLALGIQARFCHIRSTHFECKKSSTAIAELPGRLLLDIACGRDVAIVDYGCRKDRSRAIYQGVPFIEYAINRSWFGIIPDKTEIRARSNSPTTTVHNVSDIFDKWYLELERPALDKLAAYAETAITCKKKPPETGISICGISAATSHDGDKNYYEKMKHDYIETAEKRWGAAK